MSLIEIDFDLSVKHKWQHESGLVYLLRDDCLGRGINYNEITVNLVEGNRGIITRTNEAASLQALLEKFQAESLRDLHDKAIEMHDKLMRYESEQYHTDISGS